MNYNRERVSYVVNWFEDIVAYIRDGEKWILCDSNIFTVHGKQYLKGLEVCRGITNSRLFELGSDLASSRFDFSATGYSITRH